MIITGGSPAANHLQLRSEKIVDAVISENTFNSTAPLERRAKKRKTGTGSTPAQTQNPRKKRKHVVPVDASTHPNLACWAYHTLWAIQNHGAPTLLEKDSTNTKVVGQRRRHSCPSSRAAHILPFYRTFNPRISCNKQYAGFQCDEYPPAATKQGGSASVARATAMCIPGPSNGAGGQLYTKNKGVHDGDTFQFHFKQNLATLENDCKQWIRNQNRAAWRF
ncbi:hypothetical protein HDU97_007220 [Phlyctochytrium planicorne]|nr:hypothetical protein HDU97_007220 [Phlyctochytrium planicorne]